MSIKIIRYLFIVIVVLLGIFFVTSVTSSKTLGNTYTVTKYFDTDDGVCDSDCSLREAIVAANNSLGQDTILIDYGTHFITRTGTLEDDGHSGDLDILDDLIIVGDSYYYDAIVDGGGIDRVFHIVNSGTVVTFTGFTIQNGSVLTNLEDGGGIYNNGTLHLLDMKVNNNDAEIGGGIANFGGLYLDSVEIFNNGSDNTSQGGGIYSAGKLEIRESLIKDNDATDGGGLYTDENSTVIETTFEGNVADDYGGGIYSDYPLELFDSTFKRNYADFGAGLYINNEGDIQRVTFDSNVSNVGDGGGVYSSGNADVNLQNVTLTGNQGGNHGGGIYNSGIISIRNATIYQNTSFYGGGIYNESVGSVELANTIIALNPNEFNKNCQGLGTYTSLGYNLSNYVTGDSCNLTQSTDKQASDPLLNSLADNGGKTKTHALLSNSPALDAGGNTLCAETDQRWYVRPVDGEPDGSINCDIGAFERFTNGYVRFSANTAYVDEGDSIELTVTRPEGSLTTQVQYVTTYITAFPPKDFQYKSGTLEWIGADNSPKTITIETVDDLFKEKDETFEVRLSAATNGGTILAPYHKVTIVINANDLDGPPEPIYKIILPLLYK